MSRRHGSFSKARRFQIKASVQHGFLTGRWGRGDGPGRPGWLPTQASGKEVALPPPPPLRTTRECFHSCSSSLSNAPCGTRLPLPQGCRVRTAQPSLRGEPSRYRHGANTHHIMGGRTRRLSLPSSACLLKRLTRFSRDERPEGSQPAFAWGDLARGLNPYPPDYRAAFAFSLILYPPPHRRPPCGGPTPRGGRRAYHVPRTYHGWLRLCLFADGSAATAGEGRYPCTWPRTSWFKPLSAFGLLDLTTFISSSPELALPSTLAPTAIALAVVEFSREKPGHLDWVRFRCPKGFAPPDYSGRTLGRVPVVAHRVMSWQ